MNKIGFLLSGLLVIIGVCVLFTTTIINKVLPILGRTAFQAAAAGSYSPSHYFANFLYLNLCALGIIILGLLAAWYFYRQELAGVD